MTSSPREEPVEQSLEKVVTQATDNGVSWITLDRPHAMNALTWDQRERLISLLSEASADPAVRAVVLTARGRGFCAGADLKGTPGAGGERIAGDVARVIERGAQRLVGAVLDCEKPVLAAVNGTAAGLGCHLALACDLVLAAEGTAFVEVFVRRGLVPDGGGAYLLPRLIGPQKAKELMFFGDSLPAAEAERLGLVNLVVPADELAKTARAWAERLATGPTRALALTKRLVNESLDAGRAVAFASEATAQEINMTTRDAREGVDSFVQRRTPRFEGR
ncbi:MULTISPECIES: enoyl-CoA hydratase-related protein [unclassified Streptomyces]|uniref:enoyl-CoA hydratase/isomerase family protein n=1 Tax=unclassified Streptomyces TaxID=2593676 RepID=UPI002DD9E96F|nr:MULTISPECIES: enoyl-CoA hydratase-related protein [unclassified Streptomyces]WSA94057.1 enoyl-CoA hydratase-related protein [Streptomyces sp. NBC_01795]WSS13318.1 enoyl-CoA hydratase-related protein [Streptomyces sp. NBC_01186]WSS42105.1 enoyl-CoA hydratase-related protein [Streptomyces sp. NBC_01187]